MATYSVHKTYTLNTATFTNDETRKLIRFDMNVLRDNTKIGVARTCWISMKGAKRRVYIEMQMSNLSEKNNALYEAQFGYTCVSKAQGARFEICVETPEELLAFAQILKSLNPTIISPTANDTGDTLGKQINAKDYTIANAQEAFAVLNARTEVQA